MKIVLGGCLKELVWRCCWRVANVAGILLAFLLQIWKRSSSSRSSNSIQSGATSFIKDLAKRRRASGVCGCFSVCFGSGEGGDCCGPFIIIRLGLCFLNIRLLSTLSVLVVVLVVVVLDGSICSICQLQWRILHSSSICDSHSSRILHTVLWLFARGMSYRIGWQPSHKSIMFSCDLPFLPPPMGILTSVQSRSAPKELAHNSAEHFNKYLSIISGQHQSKHNMLRDTPVHWGWGAVVCPVVSED